MPLSMTGFGEAIAEFGGLHFRIEVRSVNNRHFKLHFRGPEVFCAFESEIEKQIRERIARGTVSVSIRTESASGTTTPKIQEEVLASYWTQLRDIAARLPSAVSPGLGELLLLPGVLRDDSSEKIDPELAWPALQAGLVTALEQLHQFRLKEGNAMAVDLLAVCQAIRQQLSQVALRAPQVVAEYRDKLLQRIQTLLQPADVTLDSKDILREVSLFADKCDIHEEISRLRSHLDQFEGLLRSPSAQGRKMDFLCQELFREVNTIGSKSNEIEIAHAAVEMKTAIERIRELVQNLE